MLPVFGGISGWKSTIFNGAELDTSEDGFMGMEFINGDLSKIKDSRGLIEDPRQAAERGAQDGIQ